MEDNNEGGASEQDKGIPNKEIEIVYVPFQVQSEPIPDNYTEFKAYSKNRLTDKFDIVYHTENLSFNPIQALSQVVRGGRIQTKIMFENGKVIYSPTAYERMKELMCIKVQSMYFKKQQHEQADES